MATLDALSKVRLKNASGTHILASQLWAMTPVVIFLVRRPGCILCREEALDLWSQKPAFDKLGVKLVAVVKEWRPDEIAAFTDVYWPSDELFLDEEMAFFAAINKGEKLYLPMSTLANPFSQAWKNYRRAKKTVEVSNLTGEGLVAGGLLVLRRGSGGVVLSHVEKTFGDHASMPEVLAAARKAAGR